MRPERDTPDRTKPVLKISDKMAERIRRGGVVEMLGRRWRIASVELTADALDSGEEMKIEFTEDPS